MQPIMKICYAIVLAWRRRKSSYHHILTNHPLSHKVTRAYHTFWLTNAYYFWPSSHPSAWLCKFYYQAYRWIIFYCFHTSSPHQLYIVIPRGTQKSHPSHHHRIALFQKSSFFISGQSAAATHASHIIHISPKLSHSFGTHKPSLLLGIIFLHYFARLSFIILQIFIMNIIMFRS